MFFSSSGAVAFSRLQDALFGGEVPEAASGIGRGKPGAEVVGLAGCGLAIKSLEESGARLIRGGKA